MHKPLSMESLLRDPNAGEPELVNPGEYVVGPLATDGKVNSSTGGVRTICPGRRDGDVVLRATITRGYYEGETYIAAKGLEFIDKRGNNLVLAATTTTGELLEFEISPHTTFGIVNIQKEGS